jgi:hypothetical protein
MFILSLIHSLFVALDLSRILLFVTMATAPCHFSLWFMKWTKTTTTRAKKYKYISQFVISHELERQTHKCLCALASTKEPQKHVNQGERLLFFYMHRTKETLFLVFFMCECECVWLRAREDGKIMRGKLILKGKYKSQLLSISNW